VLEDLWAAFGDSRQGDRHRAPGVGDDPGRDRAPWRQEAVRAVTEGAELLVLTDRTVYDGERRYIDPHLATSAVDQALKQFSGDGENLRRRCSLVLRSAADPQTSTT